MKKFAIALALFTFVGISVSNAATLGEDKNKKECSGEKKACCKSKSASKACHDKKEGAAKEETKADAKAEVKKEETKK